MIKHAHKPSAARRRPLPAAILIVPLLAAVILTLFAWPSARLEPRDLPIGVAGAPAAAAAVEHRLERQAGPFALERYPDESAARRAVEEREVYGAFVVAATVPEVLVASAASPMVAQLLTHAAAENAPPAPVQDLLSASPRGSALASSVLPLVIAGILTGVAASALGGRGGPGRAHRRRFGRDRPRGDRDRARLAGRRERELARQRGRLPLTVLAIAATVAGLKALLGEAGLALGAATMIFVGNPFAAVATATELLPEPVGGLGQLLPPGAGGNLLRSTGFFDGAGAGGHVAVLAAWAVGGLALLLAAGLRARRTAGAPVPVPT